MKKLVICGVLAATFACGAYSFGGATRASAAPPASATPASSVALDLARMVLPKDSYKDMLHQTSQGILAGARASGQTIPKEVEGKIETVVLEALPYDELLQFTAQVYGGRFSDKELGDIIAFYKTPTGVKLIKELPGITKDASSKVGTLLPQRLPALMKKHGLAK